MVQVPSTKVAKGTADATAVPFVYDVLPPISNKSTLIRFQLVKDTSPKKHDASDTVLSVEQHRSRTFKVNRKIVRFSVTDRAIALPVLLSNNEFVVLGMAPGTSTLALWDDTGTATGFEIKVRSAADPSQTIIATAQKEFTSAAAKSAEKPIPAVTAGALAITECRQSVECSLSQMQALLLKSKENLLRAATSNAAIVSLLPIDHGIYLWGKEPGRATVFIWDDLGNITGIAVNVTAARNLSQNASHLEASPLITHNQAASENTRTPIPPFGRSVSRTEIWSGIRKDIWEFPLDLGRHTIKEPTLINPQIHNLYSQGEAVEWHSATTDDTTAARCKSLTDEASKLMALGKYKSAITKLVEALYIDYRSRPAVSNLAAAYNKYGLSLGEQQQAIEQFHNAIYTDGNDRTVANSLEHIIHSMGKNPRNFDDRVTLGDEAGVRGDLTGAVIEYESALKIQENVPVRIKLAQAYRRLGDAQDKQSIVEYSRKEAH